MSKEYYVYIMTNKSRTLYTGVAKNLYDNLRDPSVTKSTLPQGDTPEDDINR